MFSPYCIPPNTAEAIVTAKLTQSMLQKGWQITVVSENSDSFDLSEMEPEWDARLIKSVRRFPVHKKLSSKRLSRLQWAIEAYLYGRKLLKQQSYSCIISRATPSIGHLPAYLLSLGNNIPWIACWSDPMPPRFAPPPYGQGSDGRIMNIDLLYCEAIVSRAHRHVFPNNRLQQYMQRYLPKLQNKSVIIPHLAFDDNNADSSPSSQYFVLLHAGSLALRCINTYLKGIAQFMEDQYYPADIHIVFLGSDPQQVKPLLVEYSLLDYVRFLPWMGYFSSQRNISQASVLAVVEANIPESVFLPTKFVDYIQAKRPIIAISPFKSVLHDFLKEYGGGIAADCHDAKSVASALNVFYQLWKEGKLESQYNIHSLSSQFSQSHVMRLWENLITQV